MTVLRQGLGRTVMDCVPPEFASPQGQNGSIVNSASTKVACSLSMRTLELRLGTAGAQATNRCTAVGFLPNRVGARLAEVRRGKVWETGARCALRVPGGEFCVGGECVVVEMRTVEDRALPDNLPSVNCAPRESGPLANCAPPKLPFTASDRCSREVWGAGAPSSGSSSRAAKNVSPDSALPPVNLVPANSADSPVNCTTRKFASTPRNYAMSRDLASATAPAPQPRRGYQILRLRHCVSRYCRAENSLPVLSPDLRVATSVPGRTVR